MPLSMAVGFAMISSFLLSQTLVPVLSNWFIKKGHTINTKDNLASIKSHLTNAISKTSKVNAIVVPALIIVLFMIAWFGFNKSGTEIFPKIDAGQMQVRLRLPAGTRIERIKDATKKVLSIIDSIVGKAKIEISSSYVGLHGQSYAISPIFLYTSSPHEAVIKVNLAKGAGMSIENLKEQMRSSVKNNIPEALLSFEPADLVELVMSLGANNPIEIVVQGENLAQHKKIFHYPEIYCPMKVFKYGQKCRAI
ncbi:MAG: efflux RND transporter permease subunit [Saprospiraceae bacterium]